MSTAEEYAASVGEWATGAEAYGLITVDVPAEHWIEALTAARDVLGLSFFDWLSAVDELAEGFSVVAHLASADAPGVRHLAVRTRVPRDGAALPTAVPVYAGAAWHERETHEMFGIDFPGHPYLATLLLPDGFEGYPLRKEFVLAARVAKAWPGAKEPGESDHGDGPARRKMQPAGVPDPNEWGPLKGTLPPVAERPARGARAAGAARVPRAGAGAGAGAAAGAAEGAAAVRADRPRRTRSVSEGSASQAAEATGGAAVEGAPVEGASVEGASVEGAAEAAAPPVRADRPRRTRTASDGSASQTAAAGTDSAAAGVRPERPAPRRPQSADAPWHNPVPAHEEPGAATGAKPDAALEAAPGPEPEAAAEAERAPKPEAAPAPEPAPGAGPTADRTTDGTTDGTTDETPADQAGQDGDST
ncbi:NADH-quinone oxidoreductase subunit C [Kitasatospora sp. A2-31]|uniref:NADH-quinone oxidoreductase subunit C n=1 Tax=Kitasatospora sp. A2-31 TaxID=2916414 RepID=UPI001EEA76A1|nr:NADH-quinone oxidoreductase subunit C [Kitasatospora sp. A2-31]MCG6497331.1 NADH-quinone oxidoreductase subunit C [Kitasatospora sp. A2-31]